MCGIVFSCYAEPTHETVNEYLLEKIQERGPDSFRTVCQKLPNVRGSGPEVSLFFAASVLALRGENVVEQPLEDEATGSLLCWNGEAWQFGSQPIIHENDGLLVFQRLLSCMRECREQSLNTPLEVRKCLASIVGPFAFIFYDGRERRVYYGRDILGRRSLVTRRGPNNSITVASVSCGTLGVLWDEVDADGIYEIDLDRLTAPEGNLCFHANAEQFTAWDGLKELLPRINDDPRPDTQEVLHNQPELVSSLHQVLRLAVSTRLIGLLGGPGSNASSPSLAVLFSGGLDCTVLARLIHDELPHDQPVDLINVAFENPRLRDQLKPGAGPTASIYEQCPDRITARAAHNELCTSCPERHWRLIALDIPYAETTAHRAAVVARMHPHDTEMDLSIALALYFAARGPTPASTNGDHRGHPEITARVLVSGLGADELFGGYGRHRVAYRHGGNARLVAELAQDGARLARRNLGRDDRVMASWAREPRYPYLDERVVAWAYAQPAWRKCDFARDAPPAADAAKGVLRALAARLSLHGTAREAKRAIQFGARTARMQSGKVKGTQRIEIGVD